MTEPGPDSPPELSRWSLWSFSLAWQEGARREGVIVGLSSAGSVLRFGEASPHPDVHAETAPEVASELERWLQLPQPDRQIADLSSAARFGVESALAPVGRTVTVAINGLARTPGEARALASQGYSTIKLKVGGDAEHDAHWVQEVRDSLPTIRLRLDANRRYCKEDAIRFCAAVAPLNIDYIEEPTSDPSDIPEVAAATGLRIALDESTREPQMGELLPHASALVIKPSALGRREALNLAERARSLDLAAVFTSCFESDVGLTAIGQLTAQAGSPGVAAGLGTGAELGDDLLVRPLVARDGLIIFPGAIFEEDLNWDFLTPIATS
jgi:O-succinylbenzoate synthase